MAQSTPSYSWNRERSGEGECGHWAYGEHYLTYVDGHRGAAHFDKGQGQQPDCPERGRSILDQGFESYRIA